MIQGVIATQLGVNSLGPADAILFMDFVNGVYAIDGSAVAVGTMLDAVSKINPGVGLEILLSTETTQGSGVANLIGDALATVLAAYATGCTSVIDFEVPADTPGLITLLSMVRDDWQDTLDFGDGVSINRREEFFGNECQIADTARTANDGVAHATGHHKLAATRTPSRVAISGDGDQPVADETDEGASINANAATFGGFTLAYLDNEVTIRSFALFAAQADVALPGLSAL